LKAIDYLLVDAQLGEIEGQGRCSPEDLDRIAEQPHQVKVIGTGNPATCYYTALGLREYTPEQRAAKADRKVHHRWNNQYMRWVDARPLDELRALRWAVVKAARCATVDAPIDTPFGRFDADAASRAALAEGLALSRGLAAGDSLAWTTADNAVVQLGEAQLAEVLRLIGMRTQAVHAKARALRLRIGAATTLDELEAITWEQAAVPGVSSDVPA
jgi:hypothetical protein